MLVAAAHEVLELTDMSGHGGRRGRRIATTAGVEDLPVRRQHMLPVAERIAHAVLLALREQADRAPERFEDRVAAGLRHQVVEDPVLGDEGGLVVAESAHALDRRLHRADIGLAAAAVEPVPFDQLFFDQFRIGKWPDYFDNVQFDRRPETLDQFFRSVTLNTGPYDAGVISDAMAALFDKTGPAILFLHSQAGGPGWRTAIKSRNVKAIVALEPGSGFIFPERELPPAMPSAAGTLTPEAVPLADFEKLTRIPIVVYYGDNFPTEPTAERGQDNWRVRLAMARLWVDAINRHGGDAQLVHLPEIGIRGNTHFLMSDLNNVQIADLITTFMASRKLDRQ